MSLRIILECEEDRVPAIGARISERLDRSAPTVSRMVDRMVRDGLVQVDPRRRLLLSARGRRIATAVLRKHRLAEVMLVSELGVPYEQAHAEADRLQHAIGDRVESHLFARLGQPTHSPYGNPIPGLPGIGGPRSPRASRAEVDLAAPALIGCVLVTRIGEGAQSDAKLLGQVRPGDSVVVYRDLEQVVITAQGPEIRLPMSVARAVHAVKPRRPSR
ncbi:metal-dependent transcriptional regulator [Actinoplanes sp. LDG1-06]|uniref:Metal-dependent transcriptional regulator n=2 Tax=Paractinoplanes ovalisporus TaxID=2810368 RepID=A0ABS2A4U6_9ACTN|nr:metal-dependent transcriptional regulator [Actinoplanes ovalisporus]